MERLNFKGKHLKEKILKPCLRKGYLRVKLTKDRKEKTFSVNRLVAFMFIPNPHNLTEVNHKDTNKLNNCVSNLEWCTTKENIQHAIKNGLRKISEKQRQHSREMGKKQGKLNSRKILQYDIQGNFIKEWKSATEVERQLKIYQANISKCCRGQRKTTGGYIWRYKENV